MIPLAYLKLFAIDMAIQWIGCIFAIYLKTEKFYDITGKYENIFKTIMTAFYVFVSFRIYNVHSAFIFEF